MRIQKQLKILFLFCILISFNIKQTKSGWIADKIFGALTNKVNDLAVKLLGEAKQAFRESLDYLFDTKINPLINQLEATADRVMDKARDDVNAVIDNFMKEIDIVINTAFDKAQQFVDKSIDEIKAKIIDATFDRLNQFEDKVFTDISTILNKIDAILKEVSCYAQSVVARITDEIKKVLPSFINPFEHCRIELDKLFPGQSMKIKFLSSFTPNQLYEYRKCRLISFIKDDTPIQAVKMAFRDLELLAGDMRCLSVSLGAINNEKYYIKEMGYADHVLQTFNN